VNPIRIAQEIILMFKNRAAAGLLADLQGKLAAIDQSQAVIEFDLQGNVLAANENFLQLIGYRLEEVQGVANELDSMKTQAQAQEVWDELHAKLRKRLISDEQRGLLDLFLSPDTATRVSAQATRPDYSPPGSFEMF
jgi:PAS domain-containing protein